VNTRHFSDFIVTGIPQSILENYLIEGIRSDFYPGVDDFSFINRGSYIAPGGHCAGQSIGAMWYYSAKPEGNQPLWGSYDNNFSDRLTPDFWEDDSYAYRFCSVLQKDLKWDSSERKFWLEAQGHQVWKLVNNQWELVDVPAIGPEGTRNMFALALLLTGEPQYVAIYSDSGGGHAMIVYAVTRDALHIADPNYPGDINRTIYYNNGEFDPYPSGDNWDEINAGKGENYETILYMAKSTLMSSENIVRRWQEVKDGTIGNDLFPGYEIKYFNEDTGEYQLLGENQVVTEKKIKLNISDQSGKTWGWLIYRDQSELSKDSDNKYDLVPGDNLLGLFILAKVGDKWKYVDFQYINVIREDPQFTLNVSNVTVKMNQDYEFVAYFNGVATKETSFRVEEEEGGYFYSGKEGIYKAPLKTGTYHITATYTGNTEHTATAIVNVEPLGYWHLVDVQVGGKPADYSGFDDDIDVSQTSISWTRTDDEGDSSTALFTWDELPDVITPGEAFSIPFKAEILNTVGEPGDHYSYSISRKLLIFQGEEKNYHFSWYEYEDEEGKKQPRVTLHSEISKKVEGEYIIDEFHIYTTLSGNRFMHDNGDRRLIRVKTTYDHAIVDYIYEFVVR
jgi:hypothetical protein